MDLSGLILVFAKLSPVSLPYAPDVDETHAALAVVRRWRADSIPSNFSLRTLSLRLLCGVFKVWPLLSMEIPEGSERHSAARVACVCPCFLAPWRMLYINFFLNEKPSMAFTNGSHSLGARPRCGAPF
jgi:hypothetical protein